MQLELISTPRNSVQLAWAEHTVASAWRVMRTSQATMVMVRSRDEGFSMLRRAELERFAVIQPHARLAELALHAVAVASPQSTIRQLEEQLTSSGVEAVVMIRSNELVAVLVRGDSTRRSGAHRVVSASKLRTAA